MQSRLWETLQAKCPKVFQLSDFKEKEEMKGKD